MKLAGDRTLGRLIKWLRILGIPCEMLPVRHPDEIPGDVLFLTRNRRLASPKTLVILPDRLEEQLSFLFVRQPQLKREISPFSLCLRCNASLEEISREEVFGLVPDFIYQTHNKFRKCPRCGRIYWRGSHPKRMLRKLETLSLMPKVGG